MQPLPVPDCPEASALRLAYLVSRYPAVSHTFILREVLALRRLGATVAVASVNAPDRPDARMTDSERAEAGATYYVKRDGVAGAGRALLHCLRRHPAGCLRAFARSLTLGRGVRRLYALAYLAEAMMVVRWMDGAGLRHLHVHFATAGASVGVLARAIAPVGLSLTVHGPDEFDDVEGQHLRTKVRTADLVVCISQFARSQLMRLSDPAQWRKLQVCRLGVALHADAGAPARGTATRLLCVGRLTAAKGQHVLLEACARVRAQGRDIHLTLVGQGGDEASLREHARRLGLDGCVRFAGALNETEVRAAFAAADAFVLPSLAEGIPVVLMEAMSAGVPCISCPVNGIPELIEDGTNGLLAAPGDVDALAACIGALLDDPDARRRFAAAGRQRLVDAFDLERNVARLASLFATLPQARGASASKGEQ
ncbi:glycosyltransferase [Burkholderia paludis]|uniref:glycosyltransferase n=1 Tax=Burkholderia paludis TaxID=1506587 RepID=UPI00068D0B05|nr:glycosyltransferase [Burkholderia paludis]